MGNDLKDFLSPAISLVRMNTILSYSSSSSISYTLSISVNLTISICLYGFFPVDLYEELLAEFLDVTESDFLMDLFLQICKDKILIINFK